MPLDLHREPVVCRSILLLVLCGSIACSHGVSKSPDSAGIKTGEPNTQMSDEDLIRLVKDAAGEIDNPEFLKKLGSFPRDNLIARLTRIRDGLASDDRLRPEIAFVFCYLKHEYMANRAIVVSGLYEPPERYKGFAPDDAIVMVGAMINWGDKELLKVVLARAVGSDTALAEGIAGVIEEQMQGDPENFLISLKDQPQEVKEHVYDLIEWYDTPEDRKFIDYLKVASSRPETAEISKELLTVLKAKTRKAY